MVGYYRVVEDDELPGLELASALNVSAEFGRELRNTGAWPTDPALPRWKLARAELTDLVPVLDALLVCSPRLREVLDQYAVPETLDWREVEVVDRDDAGHQYWAYRWAGPSLALGDDPSAYRTSGVPMEVFAEEQIKDYQVFGRGGPFAYMTLIVSERVRAELLTMGVTGVRFAPPRIKPSPSGK